MNDTSRQLVDAGRAAVDSGAAPVIPLAVAATLRTLSVLMAEAGWYHDAEWPSPEDLIVLADDIEGGGE